MLKEKRLENIPNIYSHNIEKNINKLKLWTLIEAYYKSIGSGLLELNSRQFYFYQDSNKINIYKDDIKLNVEVFSFTFNNYIISICQILSN